MNKFLPPFLTFGRLNDQKWFCSALLVISKNKSKSRRIDGTLSRVFFNQQLFFLSKNLKTKFKETKNSQHEIRRQMQEETIRFQQPQQLRQTQFHPNDSKQSFQIILEDKINHKHTSFNILKQETFWGHCHESLDVVKWNATRSNTQPSVQLNHKLQSTLAQTNPLILLHYQFAKIWKMKAKIIRIPKMAQSCPNRPSTNPPNK